MLGSLTMRLREDRSDEGWVIVLGVDYDTHKATLCALEFDGGQPRMQVARFRKDSATGEDSSIKALGVVGPTILNALDLFGLGVIDAGSVTVGSVAWLERGYGSSRQSDWVMGAFFGAIYAALEPVMFVNPLDLREWKRLVTKETGIGLTVKGEGNGNAKKPVANEATRALLTDAGVDSTDWTADALDAYAVAWAGRRLNERALAR